MVSALFGGLIIKDKEKAKIQMDEVVAMGEVKKKEKSEIATCLKAKLILMKNNINP